ncbi:DUF58 domain-containing protein [Gilvimarinus xylanilyticus]|uniref:DUF58 domain-containing protein n=1 Tax=Gilvimarinus xylanilyticus TaxID=2944139 RepID=A0A9X2HYJ7_9GAMM|nr:DUF58 domain-containing protein [Gilvimarinus xylanilyticus]
MFLAIKQQCKSYFWRLAERRSPRAEAVVLRHRSIYVLPSKAGLGYMLAGLLVWLLGTNYQNNLILAASFLLFALFVVSVLHAFGNLSGLQLRALKAEPGFVGETLEFPVELISSRSVFHLLLQPVRGPVLRCDLGRDQANVVKIPLAAQRRGWLKPDRLLLKSYFPLGITRVWSWVYLEGKVLVYPEPRPAQFAPQYGADSSGDQGDRVRADDDFMGFVRYQPGASLAQVAWKLYARGAGLHLKQFGAQQRQSQWLDYHALLGDVETRLSGLCFLALEWHAAEIDYGLILPGTRLEPAGGDQHLQRVLSELALFNPAEVGREV